MNVPDQIGSYRIQRILGSGGSATVYAALQTRPRRTVAIKMLRGAASDPVSLRRFQREIEILGRLRHPWVGQVYEAGIHHDGDRQIPYYVMEYVPGAKPITDYCESAGLDLRDRIKLFVKVCAAVQHGHHRRIVHRDLKPGNILIDDRGEPKIIDFGIARAPEAETLDDAEVTEPGRFTGTIQYMAPERLGSEERDADARCDVYALGAVLHRLLTGRLPHDLSGLTLFTAAKRVREREPERPSAINPALRGDLETILRKALARAPEDRYRSAGSLGRDLLRWLAHKPINARRAGYWHRLRLLMRRHRTESIAALVVLLTLGIAATALLIQNSMLRGLATPGIAPSTDRQAGAVPGGTDEGADSDSGAGSESDRTVRPPDLRRPGRDTARDGDPEHGENVVLAVPGQPVALLVAECGSRARVILALADGSAEVHDARSRRAIARIPAGATGVIGAGFVTEGAGVAVVDAGGAIRITGRPAGAADLQIVGAGNALAAVVAPPIQLDAFAPDASEATEIDTPTWIAVSHGDLTIRMHRPGDVAARIIRSTQGAFTRLASDAAGTQLAAWAPGSRALVVFDAASGQERGVARLPDADGPVLAIGFVPEGTAVLTAHPDMVVRRPLDGAPPTRRALEPGSATFAAVDPALGRVVCIAGSTLHVIDVRGPGMHTRAIERPDSDPPTAAASISALQAVAIVGSRGTVVLLPAPRVHSPS